MGDKGAPGRGALVVAGAHAGASGLLAGLAWTVQGVVYPAFRLVSDADWPCFHARHRRAITTVLALPWSAQLLSGAYLCRRRRGPGWLLVLDTVAALGPLVASATLGGWLHHGISRTRRESSVRALLTLNLFRAVAWSVATGTGLAIFAGVAEELADDDACG